MKCRVLAELDQYYHKQDMFERNQMIKEGHIKKVADDLMHGATIKKPPYTWSLEDVYGCASDSNEFFDITKEMAQAIYQPEALNKTVDKYRELLEKTALEIAKNIEGGS